MAGPLPPNNRLASSRPEGQRALTISLLDAAHIRRRLVETGVASMDRVIWSDRLFDMQASHRQAQTRTYVLERGPELIGYLTQHLSPDGRHLHIDEVALSVPCQGQGIGGVLIRFALTTARQQECMKVRLHALKQRLNFYQGLGFKRVPGRIPLKLDKESYVLMEKKLLHDPDDGLDAEC